MIGSIFRRIQFWVARRAKTHRRGHGRSRIGQLSQDKPDRTTSRLVKIAGATGLWTEGPVWRDRNIYGGCLGGYGIGWMLICLRAEAC
jgi:hypothetical protein